MLRFEYIDPLEPYKKWTTKLSDQNTKVKESAPSSKDCSERVQAAFIVSDPVDWGRDIQVKRILTFPCELSFFFLH